MLPAVEPDSALPDVHHTPGRWSNSLVRMRWLWSKRTFNVSLSFLKLQNISVCAFQLLCWRVMHKVYFLANHQYPQWNIRYTLIHPIVDKLTPPLCGYHSCRNQEMSFIFIWRIWKWIVSNLKFSFQGLVMFALTFRSTFPWIWMWDFFENCNRETFEAKTNKHQDENPLELSDQWLTIKPCTVVVKLPL